MNPIHSIADFYHYLGAIYNSSGQISASISLHDTTCAFSNVLQKQDPMFGEVFEATGNTPLQCSFRQLEKFLWNHISVACRSTDHQPVRLMPALTTRNALSSRSLLTDDALHFAALA